mmetsp:Transcript_6603/g.15052  ORF Transcript_6603/g.15052 Transcript_6603/m.15052 type:complete len:427 (-) Transcript_6603:559-1839(-)
MMDDGGTMNHLIAATLAVFAGSIVEAILGFGCSLVWMSFFPLFTTVPDAVGVLQPMHIALNAILLASTWKRCTPHALKPLAMTVPVGIVLGLWIVTSWSPSAIDCVLGVFLIVYTFLKNDESGEEPADHDHHDHHYAAAHAHNSSSTGTTTSTTLQDGATTAAAGAGPANSSGPIKRKKSNLELDPLVEVSFEEEKKDDTLSPTAEEMPYPKLEMSPLIHRHPVSVAIHNDGTSTGTANNLKIPQLNGNMNMNTNTKTANINRALPPTPTRAKTKANSSSTTTKNNNNNTAKDNIGASMPQNNPTSICAGLVGGALMGAFGTGGPAFLIFAREAGWQKRPEVFRANMQLLFFVINVPVCLSQFAEGIITYERCKASCCLLPALIAGGSFGRILATKIPREKFQILVVNGLRIMGVMFLIEATQPGE